LYRHLFFGSVEILIETKIALGGSSFSCFRPRRSGIPPIAMTPDKVEIYPKKKRGSFSKLLQRINEYRQKRISTEPVFLLF
jgi:hypothetical protein